MGRRRVLRGSGGLALVVACAVASAVAASAQAAPSPVPTSAAEQNAAILAPLVEIGKVRARSPYCAALARARPAIDAAIAYEYAAPGVARDLQHFRLDSNLTKAQSLDKLERDLRALANLTDAGRADIAALRGTAAAEGDEQKRREMADFANALDGAKNRQLALARSIAKLVGQLAETPARDAANAPGDDHGPSGLRGGRRQPAVVPTPTSGPPDRLVTYTTTQADAITDHDRLQQLFSAFGPEDLIREDLKTAAKHGTTAILLGGCTNS